MGHPTAQSSNYPTESTGLGALQKEGEVILGKGWAKGTKPCQKKP